MRIDIDFEALKRKARLERAEAVHRLIVLPVARLFSRPSTARKVVVGVLDRASA